MRSLSKCLLFSELRKGNGEDGEHDVSDHEASSSSEALAQAGHRTRSKSKSRGKEAQPLSLAKRVIGSKITGAGLVVKKRQVLGTKTASSTRNFKVSKNALLVNKNLLKGQQLLRHFPGFGNYYGTVKRFNLERNTYTLKFKDGYTEEIAFEDALKLIPKKKVGGQRRLMQLLWQNVAPCWRPWQRHALCQLNVLTLTSQNQRIGMQC